MSDDAPPSPFLTAVWTWQAIPPTVLYTVFIQGTDKHLHRRPLMRYGIAGLIGGALMALLLALFPVAGGKSALFVLETTMCFLGVTLCVDMLVLALQSRAFGKVLKML